MYSLGLIETWLQDGYDFLLRTFLLGTPTDREVMTLIIRSEIRFLEEASPDSGTRWRFPSRENTELYSLSK